MRIHKQALQPARSCPPPLSLVYTQPHTPLSLPPTPDWDNLCPLGTGPRTTYCTLIEGRIRTCRGIYTLGIPHNTLHCRPLLILLLQFMRHVAKQCSILYQPFRWIQFLSTFVLINRWRSTFLQTRDTYNPVLDITDCSDETHQQNSVLERIPSLHIYLYTHVHIG